MNSGYIDVGGNVLVLPEPPPEKQEYRAGIKNPLDKNGAPCAYATMLDECISTSGSYERYSVINGKRYSHVIDPHTGYPVKNMLSVSVITKHGIDADALSTAIFVGGRPVAEAAAKEYPGLRVLMFYVDPSAKQVESWQIGEWEDVTIPRGSFPQEEAGPTQFQPPVMKSDGK